MARSAKQAIRETKHSSKNRRAECSVISLKCRAATFAALTTNIPEDDNDGS
jgi:hypothetical protein